MSPASALTIDGRRVQECNNHFVLHHSSSDYDKSLDLLHLLDEYVERIF